MASPSRNSTHPSSASTLLDSAEGRLASQLLPLGPSTSSINLVTRSRTNLPPGISLDGHSKGNERQVCGIQLSGQAIRHLGNRNHGRALPTLNIMDLPQHRGGRQKPERHLAIRPELASDVKLLRMRHVLDKHRHYRKEKTASAHSEVEHGTMIGAPTDLSSSPTASTAQNRYHFDGVAHELITTNDFRQRFRALQAKKARQAPPSISLKRRRAGRNRRGG